MGLDMMCNIIQKRMFPWYVEPKNIEIWISLDFYLSGQDLNVCTSAKYLGRVNNNEISVDDDMYRQRCKL